MIKTLLIIISILLSSYLLFSCQKEDDVLYQGGTGKKGFEWKTFGEDNTQPKYRGEMENGRMGKEMVKEHTFHLMGKSMKENGKMIKNTVKEPKLILMVQSM